MLERVVWVRVRVTVRVTVRVKHHHVLPWVANDTGQGDVLIKFSPYSSAQAQQWSTVVRQYELGSVYKEGSLLRNRSGRSHASSLPPRVGGRF